MELGQFLFFVDRNFLFDKAGTITLADQFRDALCLQEATCNRTNATAARYC